MERDEVERSRTKTLLLDLLSSLDELQVYLNPGHPVYETIKNITRVTFSNNALLIKTADVKKKIKTELMDQESYDEDFYKKLRSFIVSDLSLLTKLFHSFFNNMIRMKKERTALKEKWKNDDPMTLFGASYLLLNQTVLSLRNNVNRYFHIGFRENTELKVADDKEKFWDTSGMTYMEFNSDINKIRENAIEIMESSDLEMKDDVLLRLQISEFLKNAILHGNKMDKNKKVRVWFDMNASFAKLIIEDEGKGFKDIKVWNRFNKKRVFYIEKRDLKNLIKYASYRTKKSTENDGGNFLFSALEYWDSGVLFNKKRNKVYLMKYFY
ncbi:MAG: hypothetical protein PHF84_01120 [bacterium]|nr:hypothetical protein [bacterium]